MEARRKKEEKVEDGERTIPKKVEKEQTETASIPTCFTRRHKKPQKRKGSDRQKKDGRLQTTRWRRTGGTKESEVRRTPGDRKGNERRRTSGHGGSWKGAGGY